MHFSQSELLINILFLLFIIVLAIQSYILYRVRRSLTQASQFIQLMNVFFKEISKTHSKSASLAVNNQDVMRQLRNKSIRSNPSHGVSCQACKYRLSYVSLDRPEMDFTYACQLTRATVVLDDQCEKFEPDAESAQPSNK